MCLAIPGKIEEIVTNEDPLQVRGRVNFGGVVKEVCLAYVPDACVGEYVIVHVGFAISKVDEQEAQTVFAYLKEMGELDEIEENGE